jgi:thioredoxin 1
MAAELTAATFQSDVVDATKPVLVDFWASWCGPCRALSPVVDEIGKEMADRLTVLKCNVDEESALAQQFGIMSIPTLILFKNGEVAHTMIGNNPKASIVEQIEAHL